VSLRRVAGLAVTAASGARPRAIGNASDQTPRPLTPSAFLRALGRFGVRPAPLPRRVRLAWTLGAYAAIAAVVWLDSACSPVALQRAPELVTAAFFGAVVTVLEIFATWVATAAEVTAAYTWIALQWLAATTAAFLVSTGAMLARVWDALKIVYSDVLKPALQWLDTTLKRYYDWLQKTFRPVFDFLRDVRDRIRQFYNTFVRPVTDTIEFFRQVNRVLLTFHIDVLQKLDRVLQQVEQRIDEPFIWINQKLNEITNWVNRIVTADGLFQRVMLVKSMSHYAPAWLRISLAARNKPLPPEGVAILEARFEPRDVGDHLDQLAAYFADEQSDVAEPYDENLRRLTALWTA
jgi:hypothetical protein